MDRVQTAAAVLHYAEGTIAPVAFHPQGCGTCARAVELVQQVDDTYTNAYERGGADEHQQDAGLRLAEIARIYRAAARNVRPFATGQLAAEWCLRAAENYERGATQIAEGGVR